MSYRALSLPYGNRVSASVLTRLGFGRILLISNYVCTSFELEFRPRVMMVVMI